MNTASSSTRRANSAALYADAVTLLPGGVNSPVRAFKNVGGGPIFMERGQGAYLYDVDGNRYLDFIGSWGPLIFGHADQAVVGAIVEAAIKGTSFGASTENEVLFAREIVEAVPSIEKLRLVNSGTEAVMSALRVARGFTGRAKIVKFEGCYHGHSDALLSKAGSGLATLGLPDSAGVPPAAAADTITLDFNDCKAVTEVFAQQGKEIACVIVEPVVGNMGCVPPEPGFLETLREITAAHGALLIFDEVMTGFRLAYGGAQARFGITPDITTLGKIVGGGLPLAAYGGRSDIMDVVAPVGPVYQAGTLSGNPLAVAAGRAMLRRLREEPPYAYLEDLVEEFAAGLRADARDAGVPVTVNQVGSMLTVFFTDGPVRSYADARRADSERFGRWFWALIEQGVYFPPSPFESAFVSAAFTPDDFTAARAAARNAFQAVAK